MKKIICKNISCVFVFIFLLSSFSISSQSLSLGEQLEQNLEQKTTLKEIMEEVYTFYESVPDDIREGGGDGLIKLKHWARWEWYMSSRLGENGEFVDVTKMQMNVLNKIERNNNKAVSGDWETLGPIGSPYSNNTSSLTGSYANGTGRIDRIAFHPTDGNIFYVGAPHGGIWKTIDGGATWEAKGDYFSAIGVSGIVVDWNSPNTIYVLTGTGDATSAPGFIGYQTAEGFAKNTDGVYKSTDGGNTWSSTGTLPLPSGVTSHRPFQMIQNPVRSAELWVGTTSGLYKTTNGGTSWSRIRTGNYFDVKIALDATGNKIYASTATTVYISDNAGTSWVQITLSSSADRIALAVSPSSTSTVYAFAGGATGTGAFEGIWRSTNGGSNWFTRTTTPNICGYALDGQDNDDQSIYDHTCVVHPTNSNIFITGGINLWKSTNGGTTMTNLTKWFETQGGTAAASTAYIHPDQHMLAYSPVNNKLYACNDGGLWESTDHGTTWTDISTGLDVGTYYHMTPYPDNPYKMLGGLQDNGAKYRAIADTNFVHMYGADGFDVGFVAGDPNEFYCSINSGVRKFTYPSGNSVNAGAGTGTVAFKVVKPHPTNANVVFVGGNNIYRSTNKGSSYSNRGASGSWDIEFAPSNSDIMYAAGGTTSFPGSSGASIYRSIDGGLNWTDIGNGTGWPAAANWNKITGIAVNHTDPNQIYLSFGGFVAGGPKILYSSNGGTSWSDFTYNLPNTPIHSITISSGNRIYIGTNEQVFRRDAGVSSWTDISDNLPLVPVTDIYINEATGNLQISTFGRGIWQFDYCKNDISLTEKQEGTLEYKVNNVLTASTEIPGNAVNDVLYSANGKVELKPGFQAVQGSKFVAKHGVCDNPAQPFRDDKDDSNSNSK